MDSVSIEKIMESVTTTIKQVSDAQFRKLDRIEDCVREVSKNNEYNHRELAVLKERITGNESRIKALEANQNKLAFIVVSIIIGMVIKGVM